MSTTILLTHCIWPRNTGKMRKYPSTVNCHRLQIHRQLTADGVILVNYLCFSAKHNVSTSVFNNKGLWLVKVSIVINIVWRETKINDTLSCQKAIKDILQLLPLLKSNQLAMAPCCERKFFINSCCERAQLVFHTRLKIYFVFIYRIIEYH